MNRFIRLIGKKTLQVFIIAVLVFMTTPIPVLATENNLPLPGIDKADEKNDVQPGWNDGSNGSGYKHPDKNFSWDDIYSGNPSSGTGSGPGPGDGSGTGGDPSSGGGGTGSGGGPVSGGGGTGSGGGPDSGGDGTGSGGGPVSGGGGTGSGGGPDSGGDGTGSGGGPGSDGDGTGSGGGPGSDGDGTGSGGGPGSDGDGTGSGGGPGSDGDGTGSGGGPGSDGDGTGSGGGPDSGGDGTGSGGGPGSDGDGTGSGGGGTGSFGGGSGGGFGSDGNGNSPSNSDLVTGIVNDVFGSSINLNNSTNNLSDIGLNSLTQISSLARATTKDDGENKRTGYEWFMDIGKTAKGTVEFFVDLADLGIHSDATNIDMIDAASIGKLSPLSILKPWVGNDYFSLAVDAVETTSSMATKFMTWNVENHAQNLAGKRNLLQKTGSFMSDTFSKTGRFFSENFNKVKSNGFNNSIKAGINKVKSVNKLAKASGVLGVIGIGFDIADTVSHYKAGEYTNMVGSIAGTVGGVLTTASLFAGPLAPALATTGLILTGASLLIEHRKTIGKVAKKTWNGVKGLFNKGVKGFKNAFSS